MSTSCASPRNTISVLWDISGAHSHTKSLNLLLARSSVPELTIATVCCTVSLKRTLTKFKWFKTLLPGWLLVIENLTTSLLFSKNLHWLPIKNRIKFKYCTIIFKTLLHNEPIYLRNLISRRTVSRLRSSDQCLLNTPYCGTVLASRAFSVAGANGVERDPPGNSKLHLSQKFQT